MAIPRPEADLEVPSDPEIRNFRSPDFRFGRETGREPPTSGPISDSESGMGKSPVSRLAANREIGDTLRMRAQQL